MSTASRLTIWVPGDVLTAGAQNAEFDNLINTVNNLNSDNIGTLTDLSFVSTLATDCINIDNSSGTGDCIECTGNSTGAVLLVTS